MDCNNNSSEKFFPVLYTKRIVHRHKMFVRRLRRSLGVSPFVVGDILNVVYNIGYITYGFEGICIASRKKGLKDANAGVVLRNILTNVGVELTISYSHTRLYKLTVADYKRKSFHYRRSKIYYIRRKLNRASRVK